MRKFINKLQNSDEQTKKLWLFILSGVSMAVVVSFWVLYMDSTLAKVSGPAKNTEVLAQVSEVQNSDAPGFFAIFSAGVKTIFDVVKDKLAVRNNIIIESPERNFVAEEVEPISATKLP